MYSSLQSNLSKLQRGSIATRSQLFNMIQITVIIPAYNAATNITDTIKSVQQQTFKDWELVIINDGSTDNTLKVLDKIRDSRLTIISIANSGVANPRNVGISRARGEYVAFLDADDLWIADKLD